MAATLPARESRTIARALDACSSPPAIEAAGVGQRFGKRTVLDDVGLIVPPGGVHALLGPNGAGKTTLIRILGGLLRPTHGSVSVAGVEAGATREFRRLIGLVPSGDRSFYLRISGLENLVFFGRLHGLRRREAVARAVAVLDDVGLGPAGGERVGHYSHGMQKRLAFARALLVDPAVLLVDEATHDLDPEGARRIRELALAAAQRGTAVLWATQRLDEIRGLTSRVTLLAHGRTAFAGTVPELLAHAVPRRYLVRLHGANSVESAAARALGGSATLEPVAGGDGADFVLDLEPSVVLGDALAALAGAGLRILTCSEERSEIEEAFLVVAGGSA